jgi:formylglycine-generating enzyme required for sulfatase activity
MKIALQIAEALDYVNSKGIVHRDIKPENIHVDPNGRIKLMDFGIAKTADLSLTKTGMTMGTPFYMAPEQVAGKPVTHLVDVYAFGMLLYELLTGVRAVSGDSIEAVLFQILNQPLDIKPMENAGAPPGVRSLVLRCADKNPENRPQSFRAIAEELRSLASPTIQEKTQPVRAPVTIRKKSPLVWLIPLFVATLAAAGAAWWLTHRPPPAIAGMIYIPAGTFLSGADKKPAQLAAFYIDETEVSNADFAEYCRSQGCPATPEGAPDLPVVRVTIAQARAFAKWKGKRLPTSLEWERAARGTAGAKYPWGDAEDATLANVSGTALAPVKSRAPYPAFNMAGNAWEMTDGEIVPSANAVAMFATLVSPAPTAQEKWIAIRGGSFHTPLAAAAAYEWSPIPERYSSADIGFRCAKNP